MRRPLAQFLLSLCAVWALIWAGWHWPTFSAVARPALSGVSEGSALQAAANEPALDSLSPAVSYPRLSVTAPMQVMANASPFDPAQWERMQEGLRSGAVLSYAGQSFAEAPVAFVTGHSSDDQPHAFAGLFAGLGQAQKGDFFSLSVDGASYRYQVVDKKVVEPNDRAAFVPPAVPGERYAQLVTCWPLFTTWNRLVVTGKMVEK